MNNEKKRILIETLKKIIAESKNDLTLDELLVRANIGEDDIDGEDYEVLREWTSVLVNEALDVVLMRSAFCAEGEAE
ncbi:hypothetical protein IL090_001707 [Enterococcus hirae]|nr:hypothetical protein [Enterococcus hirae]